MQDDNEPVETLTDLELLVLIEARLAAQERLNDTGKPSFSFLVNAARRRIRRVIANRVV